MEKKWGRNILQREDSQTSAATWKTLISTRTVGQPTTVAIYTIQSPNQTPTEIKLKEKIKSHD